MFNAWEYLKVSGRSLKVPPSKSPRVMCLREGNLGTLSRNPIRQSACIGAMTSSFKAGAEMTTATPKQFAYGVHRYQGSVEC